MSRSDDLDAWIRNKYVGMHLLDTDEEGKEEERIVHDIAFHRRRPKGYRVLTGLLKPTGRLGKTPDAVQNYIVNGDLHDLIQADINPGFAFKKD